MILYIAKRGKHDISSRTHLQALKQIYGENNIFIVDLLNEERTERERYISFGKYHCHNDKITLPFSIFVNHAVADGYHTSKLLQDIQYFVNHLDWLFN